MTTRTASRAVRTRMLDGAIRTIARDGASASMAEIAAEVGVSKALLHYHYRDRAHLLAEVVDRLAERIVSREREAMDGASEKAVDALWSWTHAELARGEVRVLLELGMLSDGAVRPRTIAAARRRRDSATTSITRLFAGLGLAPKVPASLLANASVAFMDGLALDGTSERDPRVSFDVFWLALLGLTD